MNNHDFYKTAVMLIEYGLRIISLEEISEKKQDLPEEHCVEQKRIINILLSE